jgi:hypothetical protein
MPDIIEMAILEEIVRLKRENEILKTWIKSNDVYKCAVCGKPINKINTQRRLRPFKWDSRKCFEWKSKKIVALEEEYGFDIVEILKETTRKYGKIRAQCDALGVSVPYLYSIIKKYCGDYVAFMAKHATGRRKTDYLKKFKESGKLTPKE